MSCHKIEGGLRREERYHPQPCRNIVIDHEDKQVVTVPRWAMLECDGDARDAMVLAQITWWLQPSQRDGTPRTQHLTERGGFLWMHLTDASLAEELGMSGPQVKRARHSLVERGLIICQSSKVDGCKRTLVRPVIAGSDDSVQSELDQTIPSNSPGTIPSNQLLDDLVQSRARAVPYRNQVEKTEDIPPPSPPSPFDKFWAAYPHRVARPAALSAWRRAIRKADPAIIIAGAVTYANDPRRKPDFTSQPSNWLSNERWNDEPPQGARLSRSTRSLMAWAAGDSEPRELR